MLFVPFCMDRSWPINSLPLISRMVSRALSASAASIVTVSCWWKGLGHAERPEPDDVVLNFNIGLYVKAPSRSTIFRR